MGIEEILLPFREEIIKIAAKYGAYNIRVFGSVARSEARDNSDVDFLVEFDRSVGLFEFIEVRLFLEDLLGCSVDMGTLDALREHLREPVLKDVIHVL